MQLDVQTCVLIIPYDEFVCLQHVFFEASHDSVTRNNDMFYYFELLLTQFTDGFQVGGCCRGGGAGCCVVEGEGTRVALLGCSSSSRAGCGGGDLGSDA